jgi:hypothetical protein
VKDLFVQTTGLSARSAPAAAVFNGKMYMAYTSTFSTGDANGDYEVYYGSNAGGSTAYEPVGYIHPAGGVASTNMNPALGVFNNQLYLAHPAEDQRIRVSIPVTHVEICAIGGH